MKEATSLKGTSSTATWESLETFARTKVQEFIQLLLEEEITELLGRQRSQRRAEVDGAVGYRNGHGKARKLSMQTGTVTIRRPRVRGLEERFESRILPLFERRTKEVGKLLPELYLHGLANGDFELALRGLLGEGAPLSASSIERLRSSWQLEYDQWRHRSLKDRELVYAWADGIYVKAGLEKDKAALLVVIGALRDGTKEILALVPGHRESKESWGEVLRDLKRRGLEPPKLLVADGHLGIWAAAADVWPETKEQRCWNHKALNVLDKLPQRLHGEAKKLVLSIPSSPSKAEAERRRDEFVERYRASQADAVAALQRDWDRMVTFYAFPEEHWKHLRTSNVVESPFASVRLRTSAAKRFKKVPNATVLIWKVLRVAEKRFRRLDAAERLVDVYEGRKFVDGKMVKKSEDQQRAAA
jgi:transposase-like protein